MSQQLIMSIMAVLWVALGMVSLLYLLNLPCYFRLTGNPKVYLNGVCDINDAVKLCMKTSLQGQEFLEFARNLVFNKMTPSRRNTLESANKAFMRGKGNPIQYSYALKEILSRFGFESIPVYSMKAPLPDIQIDGHPLPCRTDFHCWLLVKYENGLLPQCAYYNLDGQKMGNFNCKPVGPMILPIKIYLLTKNIIADNRAEKS